jgi:hypothetical protein
LGYGFRQDAIVCLPPVFATLLFLTRGKTPIPLRCRVLALALLVGAFLVPAWPPLKTAHDTGGNNAFYLLQGFSETSLSELHVEPASYAPVYSNTDYAVYAQICAENEMANPTARNMWNGCVMSLADSLGIAGLCRFPLLPANGLLYFGTGVLVQLLSRDNDLGIWSKNSELAGRRVLRDILATFPADFVTRWYSAASLTLRDSVTKNFGLFGVPGDNPFLNAVLSFHLPVATHLEHWGICYCAAALLLLSAVDFWLALACVFFVLYFAGYTSLSFQPRAAMHLQFLPLWAPLFLLSVSLRFAHNFRIKECGTLFCANPAGVKACILQPLRRVTVFCAITVLSLCIPLYAARACQHHTVSKLVDRYAGARLEPLKWEEPENTKPGGDGGPCLYRPVRTQTAAEDSQHAAPLSGFPFDAPKDSIHTDYLAADIDVLGDGASIGLKYEDRQANMDYTKLLDSDNNNNVTSVRWFFPVYDFSPEFRKKSSPVVLSSFLGVEVGGKATLRRLYRVTNREEFPLLMNVVLPSDQNAFKWHIDLTPLSVWEERH